MKQTTFQDRRRKRVKHLNAEILTSLLTNLYRTMLRGPSAFDAIKLDL